MESPSDIFIESSGDAPVAPAEAVVRRRWFDPRVAIVLSIVLFLVACALPAIDFKKHEHAETWQGIHCLLLGWLGLFLGVVAWLANPLYLGSLLCLFFRRARSACICCAFALLLAADTFTLTGRELPGDEGGVTKMYVGAYGAACYVWMASIVALGAGAACQWMQDRRVQQILRSREA